MDKQSAVQVQHLEARCDALEEEIRELHDLWSELKRIYERTGAALIESPIVKSRIPKKPAILRRMGY